MVSSHPSSLRDPLSDALLSALIPGLGQLNQRRFAPAAWFLAEAVTLVIVLAAAPAMRGLAIAGIIVVTLWAMIDAYRAGRTAGPVHHTS